MRTISTTGARLVEDVARLFCEPCAGTGLVLIYGFDRDTWNFLPDRDVPCPECNGRGY